MKKLLVIFVALWIAVRPAWADEMSPETKRAQIHTELGAGYFGMGKLGIALEELNTAIKVDSNYAPAYNMLGLLYMELREYDKAGDYFKRSLSLDPNNSEAHNNYGWFLCQRNHEDEAIGHFMSALKNPLYSTPEKAYLNAGECSLKKGDDKAAEAFFQRALKIQPALGPAQWRLAEINFRNGNYDEAQRYLDAFMKTGGQTREGLWLGVRIAHRLGNRDAERNYGAQLSAHFPDSREAQAYRNGQFDGTATTQGQK